MGPRERIVLIEIEETWLVIGIAPRQMRTLHTLPKGTVPEEVAAEGQFGHWLKQFRDQRNEKARKSLRYLTPLAALGLLAPAMALAQTAMPALTGTLRLAAAHHLVTVDPDLDHTDGTDLHSGRPC